MAGARSERVTVGELAAELGIARSSAANVCEALGRLGLLNEREGGFTLGPRIVELSRAYLEALVPARSFAEATRGLAETDRAPSLAPSDWPRAWPKTGRATPRGGSAPKAGCRQRDNLL